MHTQVQIKGKPLRVTLSSSALDALAARDRPLLAEMELYFSCLIRKQVRFSDPDDRADQVVVSDKLQVCFQPVMSEVCGVSESPDGPPLTAFPIVDGERFVPRWLEIGYRNGRWEGRFGY